MAGAARPTAGAGWDAIRNPIDNESVFAAQLILALQKFKSFDKIDSLTRAKLLVILGIPATADNLRDFELFVKRFSKTNKLAKQYLLPTGSALTEKKDAKDAKSAAPDENKPQKCSYHMCGKTEAHGVTLMKCGRCFKEAYCSQTCQREHWAFHKLFCGKKV